MEKILIIDNDFASREFVKKITTGHAYQVILANTSERTDRRC